MRRRAALTAAAVFILGFGALPAATNAAPEKSASITTLDVTYYYLPG